MIPRHLLLSAATAVTAGLASIASAAVSETGAPSAARLAAPGLQLAQSDGVDVYVDSRGRRVLVDARTGEVIAVEERRSGIDRLRDAGILSSIPGDPAAVERYRRFREQQLGLREPPGPDDVPLYDDRRYGRNDGFDDFGDDPFGDDDYRIYRERNRPIERRPLPAHPDERTARGEPAERLPLPENPVTGSTPPRSVEPAVRPGEGPPAVVQAPKIETERVARLQILLDRAGVSPGVIDGKMGSNVQKALDALAEMTGDRLDPTDAATIEASLADTGGPAFVTYELTAEDVAGPYVASIPEDYGHKATLDRLSFTSTSEMLAERFHMDEDYLKAINPSVDFNRPGMLVRVANPGKPKTGSVERIVADKGRKQVRAYDVDGNLVAAYPATIGSTDTPSPSGTVKVERIALDPQYTYNPKINFKQGDNDKVLTIPPGPNGPVGTVWIALSKPTYGIHGTPEPSRIGKTNSHGCVRLTNWDAAELAKMVKPGIFVQFID
ncbi:L,D-transpeptidase [Aquibium microcysteis]|uniref:L,D-transpeptidase n=1 Tax=Aquibium microcysteis TaxID=675281 RepID=UPI00165D2668|nr:L,D-transpeptidase [Aquibium microcysteis]